MPTPTDNTPLDCEISMLVKSSEILRSRLHGPIYHPDKVRQDWRDELVANHTRLRKLRSRRGK
jgi:hypothetical protein